MEWAKVFRGFNPYGKICGIVSTYFSSEILKNVQSGHLEFAWLKFYLKSSLRISEKGVGCCRVPSAVCY